MAISIFLYLKKILFLMAIFPCLLINFLRKCLASRQKHKIRSPMMTQEHAHSIQMNHKATILW